MPRSLAHAIVESAFEAGEAAIDSAVTIAARTPILARHLISPSAEGLAEWQGAASEKVLAAYEGAVAVLGGWTDLAWRSWLSPITPAGFAEEALVLARAAARPGQRRASENAARFREG